MTPITSGGDLVPHIRQQPLHLALDLAGERQQRQPRRTAKVAVEVHPVLHAGNSQFADNPCRGGGNALLLQPRQLGVALFPRGVNFVARRWR